MAINTKGNSRMLSSTEKELTNGQIPVSSSKANSGMDLSMDMESSTTYTEFMRENSGKDSCTGKACSLSTTVTSILGSLKIQH